MVDGPSPDPDIVRALELADGYLSEAEDLLWTAASESSADEIRKPIEDVTQELWELQAELETLTDDFEN
jgi:hypothetical protein